MTVIKERYKQPNIINLVLKTIAEDGSVNIYIEKCELFKRLKSK